MGEGACAGLAYRQCRLRARTSTRWALVAALAAVAALVVSPAAVPASYTIVPGGSAVTVSIANEGGTATASFSGTAGRRISLNMSSVTIKSSKVSVLKPNGNNLVTPFTVTRTGWFLDVQTLPATGTYKIVVDAKYDNTGKMTLRLYDVPPDPTAPTTADGTPATVTTTTPGQNATLTFAGTQDQRVSVELTGVTYSTAKLKIFNPDSTLLFPTALSFGTGGGFLEPKTLPATGTYTLLVDPKLLAKGSATVQVHTVPADATGAVTTDGTLSTATTTAPGQNAYKTFTAVAGQRVSVLLSGSTYGLAKVSLLKPDGTLVFSPSVSISPLGTFLDTRTLSAAGEYKVLIDPQLAETGSVDVQVYTVPPDVTGAITPGTPLTATTTAPGQNAYFTFSGVKDQRLSLNVTNVVEHEKVAVSILKPDGSALFSPALQVMSTGGFLGPTAKLPVSGTYQVKVDPVDVSKGSLDVGLYVVPADATATIAPNATPVTISTTAPGQNASLTFTLTSSKRVSLNVTDVTMATSPSGGLSLKIYRPDGTSLTSTTLGTSGTFVDTQSLTQTGTYKILLDPQLAAFGSATLTLYTVPADVTAPILTNGTPTTVAVATPGQNATLTFSASANQRVAFQVSGITAGSPRVWLERVATTPVIVFSKQTVGVDPFWFDTKSVGTSSGQFRIVLDPQGTSTGGATFKLWMVPADVGGTMTPGGSSAVTIGTPGQNARLTFSGTAGWTATITFSSGTISQAWAKLYSTNGTTQLGSAFWDPTLTSNDTVEAVLPATGTYTVLLDPVAERTGSETFSLTLSPPA